MLGARDLKQAQLGTVYTAVLKILPPFLFMLPGIFCLVLLPGLDNPDKAFMSMLNAYMPVGMMGLMIAVLFAASVAGVAGGLNACCHRRRALPARIQEEHFRHAARNHLLFRAADGRSLSAGTGVEAGDGGGGEDDVVCRDRSQPDRWFFEPAGEAAQSTVEPFHDADLLSVPLLPVHVDCRLPADPALRL